MDKKKIKLLAEEISFRLLATKKHVDHDWLVKKLEQSFDNNQPNKITTLQRLIGAFKNRRKSVITQEKN